MKESKVFHTHVKRQAYLDHNLLKPDQLSAINKIRNSLPLLCENAGKREKSEVHSGEEKKK